MRVILANEPFTDMNKSWVERAYWPAKWIGHPDQAIDEPAVVAYRRNFTLQIRSTIRIHITADERYELFLDGERVGRGPERGDRENWFYESYDLDLDSGSHTLVARTWWLGQDTPSAYAQVTVRPGFLLAAEDQPEDFLNTGVAPWECRKLGGYEFIPPWIMWGTGAKVHVKGDQFTWGFRTGDGDGWVAAKEVAPAGNASVANEYKPIWMLRPATLPAMLEETVRGGEARHVQAISTWDTMPIPVLGNENIPSETAAWNSMLQDQSTLVIPPNTMRRAIVDLGNYFCAYPEIITTDGKGSTIRIHWAEALYLQPDHKAKGHRDEIEGKYFIGIGDMFEPDGGTSRKFDTLWWEAGRYLEVVVSTGNDPLTIENLAIRETHYPYQFESQFESSDPRLAEVIPLAFRTLEMCSHETYMDCAYYEQLQYAGDTRLEVLATYAITHDDRLPRKAIDMFDKSRRNSGITQSRYPSRVMQIIPPFSLWWVGMVYDYAMWRNDPQFVAARMPGVRAVLDAFRAWINTDGLVEGPNGWNYTDWVPAWERGVPPDAKLGVNGTINWQMVYTLRLAAELEEMFNEPELAARNRRTADSVMKSTAEAFWSADRGLFAEDLAKKHFGEHSQCLALLSGSVDTDRRDSVINGLLTYEDLYRTTIYFSHYLFETYRQIGQMDHFFDRMGLWFGLKGMGFKTTAEKPEPSRSDAHAWGAHPIYHYFASVLGIRPAAPAFESVRIEPQLGPLNYAKGSLVHPKGFINTEFRVENGRLRGTVELPDGISGLLINGEETLEINPGSSTF